MTFLMYMLEPENIANWHKSTGYIPVTQSGFDYLEAEGWFEENPTFARCHQPIDEFRPGAADRRRGLRQLCPGLPDVPGSFSKHPP